MKILVVADKESDFIWDHFDKNKFNDVDLILSAGDLKDSYLSFLVTMINVPLYCVPGNHDDDFTDNSPEGCITIDDDIIVYNGIRILGLGGSYKYSTSTNQYTEKEMERKICKLKRKLKKHNGFDILLSHSPAFNLGDGKDIAHRGFQSFIDLLNEYQPSYLIHGHQHLNYSFKCKRKQQYNNTTVINAYEYYLFDYETNGFVYKQPASKLSRFFNTKHINQRG